jgi:hypothetical protein
MSGMAQVFPEFFDVEQCKHENINSVLGDHRMSVILRKM